MADAASRPPTNPSVSWQHAALPIAPAAGPLALRHCVGTAVPVRAQVIIAAAVGVPQTYYTALAEWLAERGFTVTTFDYRGHAASQHGRLRDNHADLLDWAADCNTVAHYVRSMAPHVPLYWLGHSVGAQLPGLCQPALPIDGFLAIASGSGYWRDNAAPTRRKVWLWWWGIAPLLTALCGCLPGKKLGLVGDLPAGVLWQWRRWCLHPNYAIGVEGQSAYDSYAKARYPMHAMSIEDDEMMSWRSTMSLMSWYRNCPQTMERVRMLDVPQRRIGHFGFFRKDMADHLWPRVWAVLERWQADREKPQSPTSPTGQEPQVTVPVHAPCTAQPVPGQRDFFLETL